MGLNCVLVRYTWVCVYVNACMWRWTLTRQQSIPHGRLDEWTPIRPQACLETRIDTRPIPAMAGEWCTSSRSTKSSLTEFCTTWSAPNTRANLEQAVAPVHHHGRAHCADASFTRGMGVLQSRSSMRAAKELSGKGTENCAPRRGTTGQSGDRSRRQHVTPIARIACRALARPRRSSLRSVDVSREISQLLACLSKFRIFHGVKVKI